MNNLLLFYSGLWFIYIAGQEFGTESDSDSKPDDYIVLCRTCSHCIDSDLNPYPDSDHHLLLYQFLGQMSVPGLRSMPVSGNVNNPLK